MSLEGSPWTEENDKKLLEYVEQHGKDWNLIHTLIPQYSHEELEARYFFLKSSTSFVEPDCSEILSFLGEDDILDKPNQMNTNKVFSTLLKSNPPRASTISQKDYVYFDDYDSDSYQSDYSTGTESESYDSRNLSINSTVNENDSDKIQSYVSTPIESPQRTKQKASYYEDSEAESDEDYQPNMKKGKKKNDDEIKEPKQKSDFTQEEEQCILDWVQKNGPNDWHVLANTQFPDRSTKKVKYHFASMQREEPKWSQSDDENLRNVVKQMNYKWSLISSNYYPQLTPFEVQRHYFSITIPQAPPKAKGTAWTRDEEDLLESLVQKYGRNWGAFMKYFPGRTKPSLSLHYLASMHPVTERGTSVNDLQRFTKEDDKKILSMANQNSWDEIACEIGKGKDGESIRKRYLVLTETKKKDKKISKPKKSKNWDDSEFSG